MDLDEPIIKIHDLGLAAALISSDIELLGTQRGVMQRVYFVFANNDKVGRTMNRYWNNTLKVPARMFFDNTKALKSRIYETE